MKSLRCYVIHLLGIHGKHKGVIISNRFNTRQIEKVAVQQCSVVPNVPGILGPGVGCNGGVAGVVAKSHPKIIAL